MASLANGGITRAERSDPTAEDAALPASTRRGGFQRFRRTQSVALTEEQMVLSAPSDPPLGEAIAVDLTKVVTEEVSHGRAR